MPKIVHTQVVPKQPGSIVHVLFGWDDAGRCWACIPDPNGGRLSWEPVTEEFPGEDQP